MSAPFPARRALPLFIACLCAAAGIAGCSLSRDLSKMEEPEEYAAYAEKWAPTEDAFLALQRASKPFVDTKDWPGAIALYEKLKPKFPGMEKRFDVIIGILRAPRDTSVQVQNLGSAINSRFNEIKPSVTADGTRLYFASNREGGVGELDIYVSKMQDGVWLPAQNLGDKINTKAHETLNSISFDGTQIYLYGGFPGHIDNGDNYYFEKTDKGWSAIQHLPFPVNSNMWDSDAFMTADGKALLFTSDRPGGIGKVIAKGTKFHGGEGGNSDLWVSLKRGNQWLPPMNLGDKINTPFCERSPFLHPDGKTLYFCSEGHPGLGRLDVFKSVRLREDSWTEWSEPVNLGKDINTPEEDWGYKITTDGKSAYFSSTDLPGGMGQNDIYQVSLPVAAQPEGAPVATIKGRTLDENGNPVGVTIKFGDLAKGIEAGEVHSDPQTGEYVLTLPTGENYEVFYEREGYYPSSANIDLRSSALKQRADLLAQGLDPNRNKNNGGDDPNNRNGNNNGNDPNNRNGNNNGDDPNNRNGNNNGNDPNNRNGNNNGNDPNNRNGNNNGNDPNNRNGNNNGNDPNRRNRSGVDSTLLFTIPVNMASVEGLKNKRDKWGDLLAQRVNNIFFDFGKWELKVESSRELERLVRFLQTNPDIRIQLGAHTDDVGSDSYNMDLSLKRAQSVVEYLITHSIPKARLEAKGFGKTRPEVPNDSEENRARNRRVEFRVAE